MRNRTAAFAFTTTLALTATADVSSVGATDATADIVDGAPATLTFSITRTGDSSYAVALTYTTQDGSAVAGTDYAATAGTLTIPAGDGSASVPVAVNGPTGLHADKQFTLKLTGAAGIGPAASFSAGQTFPAGSEPYSVIATDINGDGKPDLVVANINDDTVSVLLNNTAAGATALTFATQQTFPAGNGPAVVIAADLNGDGKPDLILADNLASTVSVLLNTTAAGATTPSFAATQHFACAFAPMSLAVGDLNGDGKVDLAVGSTGGMVSILLNTTAPGAAAASFSGQHTFATDEIYPVWVALADLDGDGKPDLALANSSDAGSQGISVFLNTTAAGAAAASFAAKQDFATGSGPRYLTTADVDGDGRPDLIVTSAGAATVLRNTTASAGSAAFAAQQSFATGNGAGSIVASDLNGDGKPDLAVANNTDDTLSVLINTSAPGSQAAAFAVQQAIPAGLSPTSVIASDFNGDGESDLALVNVAVPSGGAAVFTNTTAVDSSGYAVQVSAANGTGTIHYESSVPSAFSFAAVTGAAPGSAQTSAGVTIAGTNLPSAISVSNGLYSVNGGTFTAAASTVNPGDTVRVQTTASTAPGAEVTATLTVGGVSAGFSVTTAQPSSGGGAADPWMLGWLGAALLWRSRRPRAGALPGPSGRT